MPEVACCGPEGPWFAAAGQLPKRWHFGSVIVLPRAERAPLTLEGEGRGGAGDEAARGYDLTCAEWGDASAP